MRAVHFALLLFLISGLVSCGGDGGGGGSNEQEREQDGPGTPGESTSVDLIYDKELSTSERQALDSSTAALKDFDIDGSQIRRFNDIFGGGSSSNVVNFFETRVNYVLSASTDLEGRVAVSLTDHLMNAADTLASNPSSIIWYFSKASEPEQDVRFEINDQLLDIDSSRFGVIQIGQAYLRLDSVQQATTLVHEARHSDCTGGATASDIARIEAGQDPLNKLCGHAHVQCPVGHPYEGSFACDQHPWGAYIVGAIYASSVALTCDNCSQTQKTVAEAMALDSLSRPLYDVSDLLDGELGPADMSSSNQVRNE